MFTWICPQCGREVPPAYNECPDCALKQKQAAEAAGRPAAPVPPPVPPGFPPQVPPPAPPPLPPAAPPMAPPLPPVPQVARRGPGLPTWLLSILFALAFVGLFLGAIWVFDYMRDRGASASQAPNPGVQPLPASKGRPHPLQKNIEITGVRFIQNAKKTTEARFMVVNHSPDDISDLGGVVTIWGRTRQSDEEAVGTFLFKLPSIGPFEAREMSASVSTRLRVYELPDWQNLTAEVQLTSP